MQSALMAALVMAGGTVGAQLPVVQKVDGPLGVTKVTQFDDDLDTEEPPKEGFVTNGGSAPTDQSNIGVSTSPNPPISVPQPASPNTTTIPNGFRGVGIELGKNVTIGENVFIGDLAIVEDNVVLGDFVKVKAGATIGLKAVIDDGSLIDWRAALGAQVQIGKNTTVGESAVIQAGSTIDDRSVIGAKATIGRSVLISEAAAVGRGSQVQDGAAIGPMSRIQTGVHMGANSWIGFNVLVESNCTIAPLARIGGHTKIGANTVIGIQVRGSGSENRLAVRGVTPLHTNVGENCTIGPDVIIGANVALGGSSLVDTYVSIGDGASVGSGAQIGEKSIVGHGVTLAENVKVAAGAKIGEGSQLESRVSVERDAKLGKNCRLGAGVVIGRGATVGDNNQFAAGVRVLPGSTVYSNGIYGPGVVLGDPKDSSSTAPEPQKSSPPSLPTLTPSPVSVPPPILPPTPETNSVEMIKAAAVDQSPSFEAPLSQPVTVESQSKDETHGASTFILPSVIAAVAILVLVAAIAFYNRGKLRLRRRGRGSSGNKASYKDLQRDSHGGVAPDNIYFNTYKASESDEQHEMRQEVRNKDTPVPRDSFQCQQVIGPGTFGTVYRGVLYDEGIGKFSAVEIAELKDASTELRDNLWDIVEYLKQLEHPQVMACIGLSDVSTGRPPCVLYEYLSLGTLESHIAYTEEHSGGLSTKQQLWYAVQLAQGMAYLSSCGIVHGNIRSSACKLGVGSRQSYDLPILKIGDLGPHFPKATDLKYFTHTAAGKQAGRWAAPEVVTQLQYSEGSDVWSYGVVVWELAARGGTPYGDMQINDVISGLLGGRRLYRPKGTPPIVYQAMLACWRLNMDTRPQFADLAGKMARLFALELGNAARNQAPPRQPKVAIRKGSGSSINLAEHRMLSKRISGIFQSSRPERKGSKPMPIKIVEAEEAMSRRGSVSKEDFQDVPKPPTRSHSICALPQMDPSIISAAQRAGTLAPPQQNEDDSDGNVTTENTTPEVLQGSTSANPEDLIGRPLGSGAGQISPGTAEEGFAWRSAVQEPAVVGGSSTISVGEKEGGSGWASGSSSDEGSGEDMVVVNMDTANFDSLSGIPNYDSIPHGSVSMDAWR